MRWQTIAGWALAAALGAAGCGEEGAPLEAPPEAPAELAAQTPAEPDLAERSPDELEPPVPIDPAHASGAFVAARHQAALQARAAEPARAATMLEGACDDGFAPSCLALADMLEAGEGVDADPDRARGLLEQACMDGSTLACDRLGH